MKPKIRTILEECIETGIRLGHTRAHKHSDKPEDEYLFVSIEDAIWLEIDEHFEFDNDQRQALDRMVAHAEKHGLYDL